MLAGLAAVAVPIIIHLLNRSRARILDWGAMRFLLASLAAQNRRILLEEIILLALRCLLVALVVLAMARPFLPTRTMVPWAIVLPAMLGAAIALGVAAAMWSYAKARWALVGVAVLLAAVAGTASVIERLFQEKQWAAGRGEKDVAVVIDASMSMTLTVEGRTNFQRAIEEARRVVTVCEPGDAVSLILAGPVPRRVIPTPTSDRKEVFVALEQLAPIGGSMGVLEALNAAAASLAEGHNAGKKIVLITDGQVVGWDARSEARWRYLADYLNELPTPPEIICRRLPLPSTFRNVAVADVSFSRKVVGTDRPVKISVKVTNTGTMPIKPSAVELSVDGAGVARERFVTDIPPKTSETVRFEHRFSHPGPRVVGARLAFPDDMPGDNAASRVLNVIDKLPVLIVDGTPSTRPLGSAASFVEIALSPRPEEEDEAEKKKTDKDEAEDESSPDKDADAITDIEELQYLVEPKVVPAPDIATVKDLGSYPVVVLANVPGLPKSAARDLASFVRSGGGLLVAPGHRAKPTFYNAWSTAAAELIMPARLAERRSDSDNPRHLESRTFTHPALALLADPKRSDVSIALVKSYWKLAADEKDPDVRVGGLLDTGEPFMVERKFGKGYVLLTALPLDHRGSNLPTLKCFVPLLHEMVYYLAAPMMVEANVKPGSEMTFELTSTERGKSGIGSGLQAEYYGGRNFTRLKATRVDATVNFSWDQGAPLAAVGADDFSVRWTGLVQPRYSELYTFYAVADDGVRLWVDGRQLIDEWRGQNPTEYTGSVALKAGRRHEIKMEYYEDTGEAVAKLFWSSRSQRKEIIPQSQLYPLSLRSLAQATSQAASERAAEGERVEVIAPSQLRRPARLVADEDGLRVAFSETQEPGLYRLVLPQQLAEAYAPEAAEGRGLPFVVLRRPEESELETLSDAEANMVGQHVEFFQTERADELTSKVAGGVPGEELWKYLAIGALLALLGEIAVSRWIAVQRKLGAVEEVRFGGEDIDVETFRGRAKELLAVPSRETQAVSES